MDKYRAMAVFVQVVDNGSFSAAAGKLGITKSAVSQQLGQFSKEPSGTLRITCAVGAFPEKSNFL